MPKVRKRQKLSNQDIEKFANASDDTIDSKKEVMIRTTISFNEKEHEKLKQLAQKERRTFQSQVRHLLQEFLN